MFQDALSAGVLQQHSSVERFNHAYAKAAATPQQCEGFQTHMQK